MTTADEPVLRIAIWADVVSNPLLNPFGFIFQHMYQKLKIQVLK